MRLNSPRTGEDIEGQGEVIIDNPLFLDVELTAALTARDIEKAKKAAGRSDIYGLWADFRTYNMEKQSDIKNITAAFIGWCKKKRA